MSRVVEVLGLQHSHPTMLIHTNMINYVILILVIISQFKARGLSLSVIIRKFAQVIICNPIYS